MKHKLLYLLPLPALLSGMTACTTVHEHESPPRDRAPYYEPRPVYSDYDYYFYPNVAVYLQISTGFYYYEDRGRWLRVRQLPPSIHLDSRYRRQLIIRDPYPYVRYTEHARTYGSREDDHDRRDDRQPERGLRPTPPDGERHERGPERPGTEDRQYSPSVRYPKPEERRQTPPMENRGQERKDQGVPSRAQDGDWKGSKMPATPRDADKPRGYDKERATEGRPDTRPDTRRPSQDDAPPQRAHGGEERGDSKDAGPPGKQDDKGSKARTPGSKDDDNEERDRRSPRTR
jgi:hypothetical protein